MAFLPSMSSTLKNLENTPLSGVVIHKYDKDYGTMARYK